MLEPQGFHLHLSGGTSTWQALREAAVDEPPGVVLGLLSGLRDRAAAGEQVSLPGWCAPTGCTAEELDELIAVVEGAQAHPETWTTAQRVRRDPVVAVEVLRDPGCPVGLLREFALDEDAGLAQFTALDNPSMPADLLVALARDDDWQRRFSAAQARAIPGEVLSQLVDDPDPRVAGAAAGNLACPAGALRRALERGVITAPELENHRDVPWDVFDHVPIAATEGPGWPSRSLPAYLLWRFAGRGGFTYGRGWSEVARLDLPGHAEAETFAEYADRVAPDVADVVRDAFARSKEPL